MNYGFKISQNGYDVKTCETKNLIMTSKANQWKIHMKGSVTFTSNNQTVNVSHGLDYTPAYISLYHSKFWDNDRFIPTSTLQTVVNSTSLKLVGQNIDDVISYIIFKDFGA